MSESIILEFSQKDEELKAALQEALGSNVEYVEARNFDSGTAGVVQAIVPVVSALVPILVAYFSKPRTPEAQKRVVVTEGGGFTLEGYSKEDVEHLLGKIRGDAKSPGA